MPYYEGGPAGPLLLTITISAAERPLPPQQDSADLTVPMSMPDRLVAGSIKDVKEA